MERHECHLSTHIEKHFYLKTTNQTVKNMQNADVTKKYGMAL